MSLPDNRRHPAPPATSHTISVPARVRYALRTYRLLAWFFATCVVLQIFLAGMAIFVDPARWAWHRNFAHSFEVLPPIMLVLAFLARLPVQTRWLTAAPFVLLSAQYATASIGGIAGAFHPVNGLLLFWVLVTLARRAARDGAYMLIVASLAASALLVACGDQSAAASRPAATATSGGAPAAVGGAVVEMTDENRFRPEKLTIARGTTVTFANVSTAPHNAVADPDKATRMAPSSVPSGAEPFASPMLMGGDTWAHTFEVPGEYVYFCQPHVALGMVGTIVVAP